MDAKVLDPVVCGAHPVSSIIFSSSTEIEGGVSKLNAEVDAFV